MPANPYLRELPGTGGQRGYIDTAGLVNSINWQNTQNDNARYMEQDRIRKLNRNPAVYGMKKRILVNAGYDDAQADQLASDPTFWRPEWARIGIPRPYNVNPTFGGTVSHSPEANRRRAVDNALNEEAYILDRRRQMQDTAQQDTAPRSYIDNGSSVSSSRNGRALTADDIAAQEAAALKAKEDAKKLYFSRLSPTDRALHSDVLGNVTGQSRSDQMLHYVVDTGALKKNKAENDIQAGLRAAQLEQDQALKDLQASDVKSIPIQDQNSQNPSLQRNLKKGNVKWVVDYDKNGQPFRKLVGVPAKTGESYPTPDLVSLYSSKPAEGIIPAYIGRATGSLLYRDKPIDLTGQNQTLANDLSATVADETDAANAAAAAEKARTVAEAQDRLYNAQSRLKELHSTARQMGYAVNGPDLIRAKTGRYIQDANQTVPASSLLPYVDLGNNRVQPARPAVTPQNAWILRQNIDNEAGQLMNSNPHLGLSMDQARKAAADRRRGIRVNLQDYLQFNPNYDNQPVMPDFSETQDLGQPAYYP